MNPPGGDFVSLPLEVLTQLVEQVPGKTLLNLCQTDVTLANLCGDMEIWRRKVRKEFRIAELPITWKTDWRDFYIALSEDKLKKVTLLYREVIGYLYLEYSTTLTELFAMIQQRMDQLIMRLEPHVIFIHTIFGFYFVIAPTGEQAGTEIWSLPISELQEGQLWRNMEMIEITTEPYSLPPLVYIRDEKRYLISDLRPSAYPVSVVHFLRNIFPPFSDVKVRLLDYSKGEKEVVIKGERNITGNYLELYAISLARVMSFHNYLSAYLPEARAEQLGKVVALPKRPITYVPLVVEITPLLG